MWLTLTATTFVSLVILYAPGYMVARGCRIARFSALACAPVFSAFVFTVAGLVIFALGLTCPAWVVLLAGFVFCAFVFGIGRLISSRSSRPELLTVSEAPSIWKIAALYVGVSLFITLIVFIIAIGTPDGFARNDDTTAHFSMIRGMLDTGTYSTLHMSTSLDHGLLVSFYPGAWHVLVSIVASLFGNAITIATNAMTIAFVAFVFPLALCLFIRKLFGDVLWAQYAGAIFATAFCGFPWGFLVWGQLFPNMMSWMFIPPVLVMLIGLVDGKGKIDRIILAICMLLGLASIALAQPNGVFTFGIFAVLWGMTRFFYAPGYEGATVTKGRIIGAATLFIGACAVWVLLFFAPFMQTYATYTWKPTLTPLKAIAGGLLCMFSNRQGVEPLLSILVIIGIVFTCKNRRFLWISIGYVVSFTFFVIDISMAGFFKQLLTSFWYTDPNRTGAMATLFAILLATLGFAWLARGVCAWFKTHIGKNLSRKMATAIPLAVLIAVLGVGQFLPIHIKAGGNEYFLGMVKVYRENKYRYDWTRGLTSEEDAFIKRVMEELPEGTLVINVPSDGTCWSYGVEGLNTYFRRSAITGLGGEDASKLIRMHLKDVAKNKKVQKALQDFGARYVIMLDDLSGENRTNTTYKYNPKEWVGIESITPETPGFKLLMSEGDMRLYEIEVV